LFLDLFFVAGLILALVEGRLGRAGCSAHCAGGR
jgi:uncharacterized membrane protein YtjA (UPF0391 family)